MNIGFKIDARPPEDLGRLAQLAEGASFDELWVCEDLGLAGGIAQAANALSVTENLTVGLGIAPAAVRNPMYLAMEFASLARMFPGRFLPGIGHGMPRWLEQVGAHPGSLMACLEQVADSVHRILSGEEVTCSGSQVRLDGVRLAFPPAVSPPISLGVRGPKGIDLAARLKTGLILAEGSSPEYVRKVRQVVGPDQRITVFVWSCLDLDGTQAAAAAISPTIEKALRNRDLASQLGGLFGADGDGDVIGQLAVAGDVEACVAAIRRLSAAGADSVVLQPIKRTEEEQITLMRKYLMPALHT